MSRKKIVKRSPTVYSSDSPWRIHPRIMIAGYWHVIVDYKNEYYASKTSLKEAMQFVAEESKRLSKGNS